MNKLSLFLAIFLMFGCNKKTSPGPVLDGTLKGRWKMTDSFNGNANGTESHLVLTYNIFYRYTDTDSLYITDPAVTMPFSFWMLRIQLTWSTVILKCILITLPQTKWSWKIRVITDVDGCLRKLSKIYPPCSKSHIVYGFLFCPNWYIVALMTSQTAKGVN